MEELIATGDRTFLRDLAKKQLEYANLPVMAKREKLWYRHNALQGERPVVVFEDQTLTSELLPPPSCQTETARGIEQALQAALMRHELIDDDRVVPDFYAVSPIFHFREYDLDYRTTRAADAKGRMLGFHTEKTIEDLERDFTKLAPSVFNFDPISTAKAVDTANDTIEKTLRAARGCALEIIFRDIYTLNGDLSKPGRAVKIVRQLIDELW